MRVMLKITGLPTMVIMVLVISVISTDLKMFTKMSVVFPNMADCSLGEKTVANEMACGFHCQRHPDCSLMCYKDTKCQLYSARVSWHYQGLDGTPPSEQCYSLWGSGTDAASNASITAEDPNTMDFHKNFATNGFYCFDDSGHCYRSTNTYQPWWVANLGVPRRITSVRVQTRAYLSKFENVEVRVGLDTSDFTNNPLLGRYVGIPALREVITFPASTPTKGSVVSLQSMDVTGELIFCDIQILYTA